MKIKKKAEVGLRPWSQNDLPLLQRLRVPAGTHHALQRLGVGFVHRRFIETIYLIVSGIEQSVTTSEIFRR